MAKQKEVKKAAAKQPEKKKARRPKWRNVPHSSSVGSAAADALSELSSLGEECREIVDSAEGGLAETQRIQTLGETADTLEGINEPDVPESVAEVAVSWTEQVPYDKRRGPSRAARCANACACLQACADALEEWADGDERKKNEEEAQDEARTLAGELRDVADECESLEFPGMFG